MHIRRGISRDSDIFSLYRRTEPHAVQTLHAKEDYNNVNLIFRATLCSVGLMLQWHDWPSSCGTEETASSYRD